MANLTMRTQRGQPRRTKIVCTLGPASREVGVIADLVQAGLNIARINCSHGTHDEHRKTVENVREAARSVGRIVSVLFDLSGPKIRCQNIAGDAVELVASEQLTFVRGDGLGTLDAMTTTYSQLLDDLEAGDPVYLDDGKYKLQVISNDGERAVCEILNNGILRSRKGINLPGTRISAPSLTHKDREDARLGVELDADYFALSFVREARHVEELRDFLGAHDSDAPIVSKIEKPQAVENLKDIVAASDAVMVARGDLGVEMPVELVPSVQKRIVMECSRSLTPVIVATQMLESMISSPRPTRAEVSDVANAITDGADAIMLSAETAAGQYPIEAVSVMNEVARSTEKFLIEEGLHASFHKDAEGDPFRMAIIEAAGWVASQVSAKFVVVRSESGESARYLGKLRGRIPVIAVNPTDRLLRRHGLFWGVLPVKTSAHDEDLARGESPTMEQELHLLARELFHQGLAMPSDRVVVVSHHPWGERRPPNSIKVIQVGDTIGAL